MTRIWVYGPPDFYDPLVGLGRARCRARPHELRRLFCKEAFPTTHCTAISRKATTYSSPPAAAATDPTSSTT